MPGIECWSGGGDRWVDWRARTGKVKQGHGEDLRSGYVQPEVYFWSMFEHRC